MADAVWRVERRLSADHPALPGHFPGQPVFPGVVLVAEVLEALQCQPELLARLGAAAPSLNVKFLAPVWPREGADVLLTVVLTERAAGLDFEVLHGEVVAAKGQWRAG
jgi:3-hydroxyacyl-[acyl-carrier-protein] dehydratase